MIDEGPSRCDAGNPPEELPYWGSPKCSDEPQSHDPNRSPLFEKAVWFVPLDNPRPYGPDPPWEFMKYWVRVDDNVGSWRIGPPGGIDLNLESGCASPCIEILKPNAQTLPDGRQYVNLEKTGTDECELGLPENQGNQTCVTIQVHQPPEPTKKIKRIIVRYHDPSYRPPPENAPTNPGVAEDFACQRAHNDNRATHPDSPCRITPSTLPGFICILGSHCANPSRCTEASPCSEVELRVEDPPNSGTFYATFHIFFQFSTIGGDNYIISAFDPDKACNYKAHTDRASPLTVRRRVWLRITDMEPAYSHPGWNPCDLPPPPDNIQENGLIKMVIIKEALSGENK